MAQATFRKNRDGEWTVFGPASEVVAGDYCKVRKADGSVRNIYVTTVSRSFMVNNEPYVYGTIGKAPAKPRNAPKAAPKPQSYEDAMEAVYCECESDPAPKRAPS